MLTDLDWFKEVGGRATVVVNGTIFLMFLVVLTTQRAEQLVFAASVMPVLRFYQRKNTSSFKRQKKNKIGQYGTYVNISKKYSSPFNLSTRIFNLLTYQLCELKILQVLSKNVKIDNVTISRRNLSATESCELTNCEAVAAVVASEIPG